MKWWILAAAFSVMWFDSRNGYKGKILPKIAFTLFGLFVVLWVFEK